MQKQAQVAWQKYRDTVWEYSNEVRKAKAHVQLNLGRDVKINKKGFYSCTNSKKKTRENVDLLLNGARNLVIWAREVKVLNAFFALLFTGRISFHETEPLSPLGKSGAMKIYPPLRRTERWNIEISWTYASPQELTWRLIRLADVIEIGLLVFFGRSWWSGEVPEDRKEANIKKDKKDLGNCRLISSPGSLGRCGST